VTKFVTSSIAVLEATMWVKSMHYIWSK